MSSSGYNNAVVASITGKSGEMESKVSFDNKSRLFLGNLPVEKTSVQEIRRIYEKYGTISDISLHRSFGFVQFTEPEAVDAAIKATVGLHIGGKTIDPQPAQKAPKSYSSSSVATNGTKSSSRPASTASATTSRRSGYPYSSSGSSRHERDRSPGRTRDDVHETRPPRDGNVVKIILLGAGQRRFASFVADEIERTAVPFNLEMLDGRPIAAALGDAESNDSRYAVLVGKDGERSGKVTLKLLFERNKGVNGVCPTFECVVQEACDRIVDSERKLGFGRAGRSNPPPPAQPTLTHPPPPVADFYHQSTQQALATPYHPNPYPPPPAYSYPPPNPHHPSMAAYGAPPPPYHHYPAAPPPQAAPPPTVYTAPPHPMQQHSMQHPPPHSYREYEPPRRDYEPPRRDYEPPHRDYEPPHRDYEPQQQHHSSSSRSPIQKAPVLSSDQVQGLKNLLNRALQPKTS